MGDAALLEELSAAGIRLHRDGDRLRVEIPTGASLDPFRDQISTNKPMLLRQLRQKEIVTAATVDSAEFNREHYEQLWHRWSALPAPAAEVAVLAAQLEVGWAWLDAHPDHPEVEAFLTRWVERLSQYQRAYGAREP